MTATSDASAGPVRGSRDVLTLVYAVFVAGLCSIIYELLIATSVTYFQGDSVRAFSLTIGLYMAALGAGAFLSKFIRTNLMRALVVAETALGLLGGFSVPILYLAFGFTDEMFVPAWIGLTVAVGLLIGLEVPLLTRILERYDTLRVSIAHVLTLDYGGALLATVAFPLLLLPFLGTFRVGLVFGLINMSIGLLLLWQFPARIGRQSAQLFRLLSLVIVAAIGLGLYLANDVLHAWNRSVFDGRTIYAKRTRFQQVVLSTYRGDLRLYLNGSLQFSSRDEHRYHEPLVHIPLAALRARTRRPADVLLLGGGDGLAVREVLKHGDVRSVTLVDLDPAMLRLARDNVHLRRINADSLRNPKVRVVAGDALGFLKARGRLYDVIIADLPDPSTSALARLYAVGFYRLVRLNLAPDGVFATQATSPYAARAAFWTIRATVAAAFSHVRPYHVQVPSFGEWGFVIAASAPLDIAEIARGVTDKTRFLDAATARRAFQFDKDMQPVSAEPSTFDRPVVLRRYLDGWSHWDR